MLQPRPRGLTRARRAARKAELVRSLGAHRVIDHNVEDVAGVLAAEYPNGVDVVYEGVGGRMLVTAMNALAERGRLLIIGYISGYPVRLCIQFCKSVPHASP